MQTKTLTVVGGGIVVVAVAAAIYLRPTQDQIRADRTQAEQAAVEAALPAPNGDVEAEVPALQDAPVVAMVPAPPEPLRITDRRFEQDGSLLVSGTAPANMPLSLMIDGVEVERVDVGADGSFVLIGFIGHSDTPRRMDLMSDPDGVAMLSDQSFILDANPAPVIVAVAEDTAAPVEQTTQIDPALAQNLAVPTEVAEVPLDVAVIDPIAPDPDGAGEPAEIALTPDANTEAVVQTQIAAAEPEAKPEAEDTASPAILAISDDGVEVVQPPVAFGTPPEVMSNVALDTITYDLQGDVELRGRATGSGFVQVYVNNAPISRLPIDENGSWRGDLPDVDTGIYTLRIDEVDTDGEVLSRIETPFLREDRADVVEAMAEDVADPSFTVATRTVQPGATLWAIAEERYGSGVLYVALFEANKDRIRDPDLIYPGQVFMMPDGVDGAEPANN